jgi:hypothetical protein
MNPPQQKRKASQTSGGFTPHAHHTMDAQSVIPTERPHQHERVKPPLGADLGPLLPDFFSRPSEPEANAPVLAAPPSLKCTPSPTLFVGEGGRA